MSTIQSMSVAGYALAVLAMGCSGSITEDNTYKPGDRDTTLTSTAGTMRVSAETYADDADATDDVSSVETECGDATGVHIGLTDADGNEQSCDEVWADVTVSGEYADGATGDHFLADCLFVGAPGEWTINSIDAIDADLDALSCCDSDFDSSVTVEDSETTEVSGQIECDTVGNGALDIYVTINTPPDINDVTISPSKFGETCSVITLTASASDPQGDAISYGWFVIDSPAGAVYELGEMDETAYFATDTMGDYTIRVTVSDELGASHSLDFPLHIVGDDLGTDCDVNDLVGEYCDL